MNDRNNRMRYPYGQQNMQAPSQPQQAFTQMPYAQDMGGTNPDQPKFVRAPFYPTAPFYSTNETVGYQSRYYSTGIVDGTVNVEQLQRIQFDLPCRLIAINAAVQTTEGTINRIVNDPLDLFLISLAYTTGDQILVGTRLASTVCGTGSEPAELGGTGYAINTGASMQIGITPLFAQLRIDIVLVCLEMRGSTNYSMGG
jgi:hypothetical protein